MKYEHPKIVVGAPVLLDSDTHADLIRNAIEVANLSVSTNVMRNVASHCGELFLDEIPLGVPEFVSVDFAMTAAGVFKVIELQGFPSISHFLLATEGKVSPSVDVTARQQLLGRVIAGGVMTEYNIERIKTWEDFQYARRDLGLMLADIMDYERIGECVYLGGKRVDVIYNRVIFSDLSPDDLRQARATFNGAKVTWVNYPNWYLLVNKLSMLFIEHSSILKCGLLNGSVVFDPLYIIKPVLDYGGKGFVLAPTKAQFDSANSIGAHMMYQERVAYNADIGGAGDMRVMLAYDRGEYRYIGGFMRPARDVMGPSVCVIRHILQS
jgi:hypothetical protein